MAWNLSILLLVAFQVFFAKCALIDIETNSCKSYSKKCDFNFDNPPSAHMKESESLYYSFRFSEESTTAYISIPVFYGSVDICLRSNGDPNKASSVCSLDSFYTRDILRIVSTF